MAARIFLALSALVWLLYGLYCLLVPGSLAEAAGVAATTPTGTTELRAMYGYPEMTAALRAKIFGLNASRVYAISADEVKKHMRADTVAQERLAYREHPDPHYLTYGPKSRREFLNLLRWNGGSCA